MGTAGALSLLPKTINHPLLIMNGDILTKINIPQFLEFHENNSADITVAGSEHYYTSPYGVLEVEGINFKSINELSFYKKKYKNIKCPVSKKWGSEQISLPFHVKITKKEIKKISEEIDKFFKNF